MGVDNICKAGHDSMTTWSDGVFFLMGYGGKIV